MLRPRALHLRERVLAHLVHGLTAKLGHRGVLLRAAKPARELLSIKACLGCRRIQTIAVHIVAVLALGFLGRCHHEARLLVRRDLPRRHVGTRCSDLLDL